MLGPIHWMLHVRMHWPVYRHRRCHWECGTTSPTLKIFATPATNLATVMVMVSNIVVWETLSHRKTRCEIPNTPNLEYRTKYILISCIIMYFSFWFSEMSRVHSTILLKIPHAFNNQVPVWTFWACCPTEAHRRRKGRSTGEVTQLAPDLEKTANIP